jgi:hypothetical protein
LSETNIECVSSLNVKIGIMRNDCACWDRLWENRKINGGAVDIICGPPDEIAALTIRASAEHGVVHRAAPARIGICNRGADIVIVGGQL